MADMQSLGGALAEAEGWIDDLMHRLRWHDRSKVYAALLGTLHALRDSLPRDEVVYVGTQMPPLLRGLYYEGWHPTARVSAKSRDVFLERIHKQCVATRALTPSRSLTPSSLSSRPVCLQANSRMRRPLRPNRYVPFGQAEAEVPAEDNQPIERNDQEDESAPAFEEI